jgi:hypothetical protein
MSRQPPKSTTKAPTPKRPPSPFAPGAFLSGSAEQVQELCHELALHAGKRFANRKLSTWESVGASIVAELRAAGHDLSSFDRSEGFTEWQALWHHPRGSFSLFLTFRAPAEVEVSWKTETETFTARA